MKSVPGIPCPSRHAWPRPAVVPRLRPGISLSCLQPSFCHTEPEGRVYLLKPVLFTPPPAQSCLGCCHRPTIWTHDSTRRGKVHLANSATGGIGLKQRRVIGGGSGWGRVNGAGPILPYGPAPQIGLVGASGGAGPLHENRPAPLRILTCTIQRTDLHRTNGLQRYTSPGITRLKYGTYHITNQLDTV